MAFTDGSVPQSLTWERLRDVHSKRKWFIQGNVVALCPCFGSSVKALNGKVVTITGYLIPVDLENHTYVLSAFSNSQCFFCGGGGPESVMMLKPRRRFNTDERRCLTGVLRLNVTDLYELNYVLEQATLCPP